jgi:hypothetical protein
VRSQEASALFFSSNKHSSADNQTAESTMACRCALLALLLLILVAFTAAQALVTGKDLDHRDGLAIRVVYREQ